MVKIYIKNITLKALEDKIELFSKYSLKEYNITTLYSQEEDGIYIMENNSIFAIEPLFEDFTKEIKFGNLDLLLDYSKLIKIKVLSQLPVHYILSKITRREYTMDNIKIIIDGIWEKTKITNYKKKNLLEEYTKKFIPIDFYLETKIEYESKEIESLFQNRFL